MFTARTPATAIQRLRLEAEYYDPAIIEQLRWMDKWRALLIPLDDLCEYITDGTHITPSYTQEGVRFLSSTNINSGWIDFEDTKFISQDEHLQLGRAKCNPTVGDILLAKNGKIGTAAIYRQHHPPVSLFVSVALLRYTSTIDRDYVVAFLNSAGGWSQFSRSSKTGVITNLHLEEIREVVVPAVHRDAQRYIGDKVRQAERLQEFVRVTEISLRSTFAYLADGLPMCPKAWRTPGPILDPYRVNPSHYDPVVLHMLQEAAAKVKLSELGCLLGDRGISGGATPVGADYRDSGVFFVRVQNVKPYRLDLSDAAYLSRDQDDQLARSRCAANDIIFSITGYPGTASLVMDDDLPLNINQHCVRFDVCSPHDAAYIVAAMNSPFVKRQVDRLAIGGTRDALDYPSVRSLLIPMLDDPAMEQVGHSVRELNRAARMSQRLFLVAKWLTEALIEGKIAESELIEIQHEMEKGKCRADRDLLDRFTSKGLGLAGSPKLFPDLDALYRTLSELESGAEVEAK